MEIERKYAQVFRGINRVDLIGDESLGMSLNNELVYSIGVCHHSQKDEIEINMIYNPDENIFFTPDLNYYADYEMKHKNFTKEELDQLDREEMILDQQIALLEIKSLLENKG